MIDLFTFQFNYNPVKHGYVLKAVDWPFSNIHRDIRAGIHQIGELAYLMLKADLGKAEKLIGWSSLTLTKTYAGSYDTPVV